MADDLGLSELDYFVGTESYHKLGFFRSQATDGVAYIMENGYSWFVTDMLAVIETKLKGKDNFFVLRLNVSNNTAKAVITDGNKKVLYRQEYKYTNAKKDLVLYWQDGIIMLSREY